MYGCDHDEKRGEIGGMIEERNLDVLAVVKQISRVKGSDWWDEEVKLLVKEKRGVWMVLTWKECKLLGMYKRK